MKKNLTEETEMEEIEDKTEVVPKVVEEITNTNKQVLK